MADVPTPAPSPAAPAGARQTLATYGTYEEAQRAVDFLSDRKFPVDRVAIVGRGLRFEEQVLGRQTIGSAALSGAGQGALLGLLFGLFLWAISANDVAAGWIILYAFLWGALVGAILGAVFHTATGGQRDFRSASRMTADHYDVLVDAPVADEAKRLLAELQ